MAIRERIDSALASARVLWLAIVEWVHRGRNPERIRQWKAKETYIAMAEAFSAISGVKIITEKEALKEIKKGVQVTELSIKDVFYGKLDDSWDENYKEKLYYIPDSEYDPDYNHDFTNYEGDDSNCTRGGYPYKRPAGWDRKAVRVLGKYEDDVWLGQDGWRDLSSEGEWAVSYHGTKIQNIPSIVADGYDAEKSKRQKYGKGIYSTPDIKVAEFYATEFSYKGKPYKCILQNRVNPEKMEAVQSDKRKWDYFITENEDDIRPYGVCLKELSRE